MEGKKYGGREKGTPNKVTAEAKEMIKGIVNNYLEAKVFEDLDEVDAATRLNVMVKLSAYIVPKERDVNLNVKEKNQLQGPMGELSRMTAAQMIKARPDLAKMLLDSLKENEENAQKAIE